MRSSVFVLVFLFSLFSLPVVSFADSLSWHDQQRIGQVFLIFFVFVWVVFRGGCFCLDKKVLFVLAVLFGLAFLSSLLASQPMWALVELSLFVGCFFVVCAVRDWRVLCQGKMDYVLLGGLSVTALSILLKFFVSYFIAIAVRGSIDAMLLFDGFSWPRFLGQFQTLSLPFLILPVLLGSRYGRWFVLLCALWWFATIAAGTRASWVGMAAGIVIVPLLFKGGWRYSLLQVACAALGVVLYILLMRLVPQWLGLSVGNLADDRLTTSLSGREWLWGDAWRMTLERPWLGYGPMHFAELAHPYGAHPHQAILQWTSEWGIPSFILMSVLLGRAFFMFLKGSSREKGQDPLRLCLVASFVASAVHAMADGSLVMPYTQLWLAVLIGWAWGLYGGEDSGFLPRWGYLLGVGVLVSAVVILLSVVVRDFSGVVSNYDASESPWREAPRFWQKGMIKTL